MLAKPLCGGTRDRVSGDPLRCNKSRTEAGHRVLSSISRLSKHRVVPSDGSDAKDPVRWPSGGPDIDVTVVVSSLSVVGAQCAERPQIGHRCPPPCLLVDQPAVPAPHATSRWVRCQRPGQTAVRRSRDRGNSRRELPWCRRHALRYATVDRTPMPTTVSSGRSAGCPSTACYQPMGQMPKTRSDGRQAVPRSR